MSGRYYKAANNNRLTFSICKYGITSKTSVVLNITVFKAGGILCLRLLKREFVSCGDYSVLKLYFILTLCISKKLGTSRTSVILDITILEASCIFSVNLTQAMTGCRNGGYFVKIMIAIFIREDSATFKTLVIFFVTVNLTRSIFLFKVIHTMATVEQVSTAIIAVSVAVAVTYTVILGNNDFCVRYFILCIGIREELTARRTSVIFYVTGFVTISFLSLCSYESIFMGCRDYSVQLRYFISSFAIRKILLTHRADIMLRITVFSTSRIFCLFLLQFVRCRNANSCKVSFSLGILIIKKLITCGTFVIRFVTVFCTGSRNTSMIH